MVIADHNRIQKILKNYLDYRIAVSLIFSIIGIFILLFSFSSSKAQNISFLNQSEIAWLKEIQQPIKIGITSMPSQIVVTGKNIYKGFSIDLFKKIEKSIGIKFEYVYFKTWSDVVNAGINGNIDIIFLAQKTESRLAYFDFTDAILSQQNKIITRVGKSRNISTEELSGLKVAVSKGSAVFEYLKYYFENITLIPTENEEESLLYVSKGLADAAISESVRASHYLEKLNIKNLRIAGDLDYDYHLRVASRNDLPILNIILTKAIDAIPVEDIHALHLKWGVVKDKDSYFSKQVLIYFSIAFGLIIPLILYVSFLNKQLREKIYEKRNALKALQSAHDEIHHLKFLAEQEARTDDLTHVLNKRGFREELQKHIETFSHTHNTFSLVLIDIDYFKKINDKMGHDTGDKVLSEFTRILKNTIQTYNIIGRVGGEEFAFILPNTHIDNAVKTTESLRTIINNHIFSINNFTFQVSASFGVSEATREDTANSLFKRTDELLYQSKSSGRNRVSHLLTNELDMIKKRA